MAQTRKKYTLIFVMKMLDDFLIIGAKKIATNLCIAMARMIKSVVYIYQCHNVIRKPWFCCC